MTPPPKLTGGVSGFWKLEGRRSLSESYLERPVILGRETQTVQGDPAGKEHENEGPSSPHPCWSVAGASHWPSTAVDHMCQSPRAKAGLRRKKSGYRGTKRKRSSQSSFSEPLLFCLYLCDVLQTLDLALLL